jgi:UDP-N-acetylmuramate--alanine ligase
VRVTVGHRADNPDLPHATRVVVTAAVPPDNPELQAAQASGLRVVKRAAVLGRLMAERTGIAVAGTHGKTTTTAMIAFILRDAGRDPAFLVGGVLRDLGTGGAWGAGPELVVEADEYDRSFWHLHPQIAVITNIEAEHLDIYGDLAGVRAGFRRFAENLQPGGTLFCCGDDPGAETLAAELVDAWQGGDRGVMVYGTGWECAWRAEDLGQTEDGSAFAAYYRGELLARVSLRLPGAHNILNALAALAASVRAGISPEVAAEALSRFSGTGRRFERKGEAGGVLVVDDYAHHPTEIAATIAAARRHFLRGR